MDALQAEITAYNASVEAANVLIAERRAATGVADVRALQTELDRLALTKLRHQPDIAIVCDEYRALANAKTTIEAQKARRGEPASAGE